MQKAIKNTAKTLAVSLVMVCMLIVVNAIITHGPTQAKGPLAHTHGLADAPEGQAEQYPPTQQGVLDAVEETATLTNIKITTQCLLVQGGFFTKLSISADRKIAGEVFLDITQANEAPSSASLGSLRGEPLSIINYLPAYTGPDSTSADAMFDIYLGISEVEHIATIRAVCEAPPLST